MSTVDTTEYKWAVRKGNTARLTMAYQQLDGTPVTLSGCTATLYIYNGSDVFASYSTAPEISIDGPAGTVSILLSKDQILAIGAAFEMGEYELNVLFPNGDELTLLDGPLVVRAGRGPFV